MRAGPRFLLFGFLIFCVFRVYPLLIGADSLVSVEPFTTVPTVDTAPNQILQFAFMQNGFALQNASTTCTFGAVFPVAGTVGLTGGTLYLGTDLIFQNPATLLSTGYFWGNSHQIDFSQSVTWLSATFTSQFSNASVFLNNDLTIAGTVKFLGSCLLDGGWNSVTLNTGAKMIVGHNATLTLRNMNIEGIIGSNLSCLDDTASLILDNVCWVQSGDYSFTRGALLFLNEVDITGQHVFNFSPSLQSTIENNSTLYFDIGTTFNYSPQVANKTLLSMGSTSFLSLNGCSVVATRTGLQLSQGTLIIDNNVTLSSGALYVAEGIVLQSSLNIMVLGSAVLNLFGIIVSN